MKKQILVPLRRNDGIDEVIPYVERIAQPGMKVVFLFRYPVDGFIRSKSEEASIRQAVLETEKLGRHYSWKENLKRAESKASPASEALRLKGAEVAVDLYGGSLREVVRRYSSEGNVHLIMTHAGIGNWITRVLNGTNSVLKLFKRPSFSPVLLIHPHTLL